MKPIRRALALLALAAVAVMAPPASAGGGISVTVATPYAGQLRTFNLYVAPRVPASTPVPLLIVLHGLYLDPASSEAASGLDSVGDNQDVAVAYPAGIGSSWNAGTCCGPAQRDGIDDVGFLVHVVNLIGQIRPIDLDRVYVAGFSNGGMMALRAVCDRPDVFAAAVSVSGTLQTPCVGRQPVNAMLIHGLRDSTIRYYGEAHSRFLGVPITALPTAAARLAKRSGCTANRVTAASGYLRKQYAGCSEESSVQLLTVPTMSHRWPSLAREGVDGGALTWAFLQAQRRLP
ncbi:MAG: PHB depolymerase family esterase [Mycobacteriales bacterium]